MLKNLSTLYHHEECFLLTHDLPRLYLLLIFLFLDDSQDHKKRMVLTAFRFSTWDSLSS